MDANNLLTYQAKARSPLINALLNGCIPGLGYALCGRWILGLFAFVSSFTLIVASMGIFAIPIFLLLVVDGATAARQYNQKLTKRLSERRGDQ